MNNKKQKSHVYKVILIGDCRVGKTSLVNQLVHKDKNSNKNHRPTIGVQYVLKIFRSKNSNREFKCQVWDTSGAQKYQSITSSYYRKSQGAILIFDLSQRQTFDNIVKWLNDIKKYTDKNISIMLVGNKIDLVENDQQKRKISLEQISKFCMQNNLTYKQTSAITGYNVSQVFQDIIQKIDDIIMRNGQFINEISDVKSIDKTFYRNPSDVILSERKQQLDIKCPKCC